MTDAAADAGTAGSGRRQPALPGPTRRSLLTLAAGAAAGVLISGCKGIQALGTPPPPAPDIRALERAITAERLLVARYAAAIRQLGSRDAAVLPAVRAVHEEHVAHLAQLTRRLSQPAGAASPRPVATATAGWSGSSPGTGPAALLASLERAEQAASDDLLGELASLPPSLAQLFASIAASEATHVPYLHAAGGR